MLPEPDRSTTALDQIKFDLREVQDQDISWIKDLMAREWGDESIVVHGDLYLPHKLPGFIAILPSGKPVGLVTYLIDDQECEIITLNSLIREKGIGTSLVEAVKETAERNTCKSISVTTTNDNREAIDFYKKRGFEISAIHRGAVEHDRKIKPSIPLKSKEGIPIKDEIEMEMTIIGI